MKQYLPLTIVGSNVSFIRGHLSNQGTGSNVSFIWGHLSNQGTGPKVEVPGLWASKAVHLYLTACMPMLLCVYLVTCIMSCVTLHH